MPRLRRRGHVMSMLTVEQSFELLLGPITEGAFANDSERRSAWHRYRGELMASVNEFSRPWAFWAFEVGRVPSPSAGDRQVDLLRELNLLSEAERTILAGNSPLAQMLRWRENNATA